MPTYRYRCAKCGDEFEQWQSFDDKPLAKHGDCGGKLAKVLSTPGIVLKGSGFYRTDSRNGASRGSKREQPSESTSESASSEGDSASSKPSTSANTGSPAKADSDASGDRGEGKGSARSESSKGARSST